MSKSIYTATERAQRCVLTLEQAVYQACKTRRGALGQIAEVYGVNYNTLALQVNPNRSCHTLAPETIELVLEHTQSPRIMDAICAAHGNAGWFLLPECDDANDDMTSIAELGQRFADMNSTALDAYADQIIEPDEYKAMEKVAHALQRQIQNIMGKAKRNMEKNNA